MTTRTRSLLRPPLLTLIAVGALTAGLLAMASARAGSAETLDAQADPVLELALDPLAPSADPTKAREAAVALGAVVEKLPGCEKSELASVADKSNLVVRATVWRSMADAEAASLALDGRAEVAGLQQSVDAASRSVSHFRRLRESVYSQDPTGHLEVVVFRTKPGTTREANLALFDKAEADFAGGEGLRAHSLWIAPDGRWVHLLRWRSAADYEKTGKALFQKPGVGGWIRSLDFKRFVVTRGDTFAAVK